MPNLPWAAVDKAGNIHHLLLQLPGATFHSSTISLSSIFSTGHLDSVRPIRDTLA